ncbi:MAG TPA: xanthine dehydrogenase family protein subunit M [Desulfatiglandales bacterium]|nr:xanthine dehydrogenase family protein subunit M [Desulfatiglandales bacterium]
MRFEYTEPVTIEDAVNLLAKHNGKAKVIAGGTDLIVQMRQKMIKSDHLIDIARIPGLDRIDYDDEGGLRIGALTTIRAIEKSAEIRENYPAISQAASKLASVAIRNLGTVGGNLCNASPSAEMAPALIGLGANVKIVGPEGEREVVLEDFFTGPGSTVLKKGELLVEIHVPVSLPGTRSVYLKHAVRGAMDLALVGVAVVIVMDPGDGVCQDIRVVLGAVAPTPMRARSAEEVIKGKRMDKSLIEKSAEAASAEASPISDVRASAEYRSQMVKVFTRRALSQVTGATEVN